MLKISKKKWEAVEKHALARLTSWSGISLIAPTSDFATLWRIIVKFKNGAIQRHKCHSKMLTCKLTLWFPDLFCLTHTTSHVQMGTSDLHTRLCVDETRADDDEHPWNYMLLLVKNYQLQACLFTPIFPLSTSPFSFQLSWFIFKNFNWIPLVKEPDRKKLKGNI